MSIGPEEIATEAALFISLATALLASSTSATATTSASASASASSSSSSSSSGSSAAREAPSFVAVPSLFAMRMSSSAGCSCRLASELCSPCASDSATVGLAPDLARCRLFWNQTWIWRGRTLRRVESCWRSSRPGHFSSKNTRSSSITSSGSSTHRLFMLFRLASSSSASARPESAVDLTLALLCAWRLPSLRCAGGRMTYGSTEGRGGGIE
mmetsp:Transcript_31632/g.78802  ORF Transcript_31632/g.78802 Transcript_31632/m.78802 type:complete len:212 (-) Transcript_31632:649-1284(-)